MHKKRLYLLIGSCVAFVVAILMLAVLTANQQAQNRQQTDDKPRMEYAGNLACLPHKNVQPGQPETLECTTGLRAEDGKYYALQDIPEEYQYIEFSSDIIVTGDLTGPAANDYYDTVGTIKVRDIEVIPSTSD